MDDLVPPFQETSIFHCFHDQQHDDPGMGAGRWQRQAPRPMSTFRLETSSTQVKDICNEERPFFGCWLDGYRIWDSYGIDNGNILGISWNIYIVWEYVYIYICIYIYTYIYIYMYGKSRLHGIISCLEDRTKQLVNVTLGIVSLLFFVAYPLRWSSERSQVSLDLVMLGETFSMAGHLKESGRFFPSQMGFSEINQF